MLNKVLVALVAGARCEAGASEDTAVDHMRHGHKSEAVLKHLLEAKLE